MKYLKDYLHETYPNGHKLFVDISVEELDLHNKKNHDYAAGGSPTGNFERVARILSNYPNLDFTDPIVVCLFWMLKQLDVILWSLSQKITLKVDSLDHRFGDVCVYTKIARCMWRDRGEGPTGELAPVKQVPPESTGDVGPS